MTPYYRDSLVTLYCEDARSALRKLPSGSVHCVVTSPPYWGLRDYGLPPLVWDEPGGCEHEWGEPECEHHPGQVEQTKWKDAEAAGHGQTAKSGQFCLGCSAWRGSLGLEPTPELYVQHLVAIFRDVRRVLRDDGTLWLNLGDSYAVSSGTGGTTSFQPSAPMFAYTRPAPAGLKPKDLVGIPWRVAFALQESGWYLRSDIIWSKPNPMPESVTDRPTKSHEYLFLLTKSERYYWDAATVAEPRRTLGRRPQPDHQQQQERRRRLGAARSAEVRQALAIKGTRNIRSVWTIATQPYTGSHYSTFPEELARRCILAGCPPGGIVLDPFGGSGTTAKAAQDLGRSCVHVDLAYHELAADRLLAPARRRPVPDAYLSDMGAMDRLADAVSAALDSPTTT